MLIWEPVQRNHIYCEMWEFLWPEYKLIETLQLQITSKNQGLWTFSSVLGRLHIPRLGLQILWNSYSGWQTGLVAQVLNLVTASLSKGTQGTYYVYSISGEWGRVKGLRRLPEAASFLRGVFNLPFGKGTWISKAVRVKLISECISNTYKY